MHLAENPTAGVWLQTGGVAEQERVQREFLEVIFIRLRDQGSSKAGVETRVDIACCMTHGHFGRQHHSHCRRAPCFDAVREPDRSRQCPDWVDINLCRLQPVIQQVRNAVADVLENCSLAQLARASKRPPRFGRRKVGSASTQKNVNHRRTRRCAEGPFDTSLRTAVRRQVLFRPPHNSLLI